MSGDGALVDEAAAAPRGRGRPADPGRRDRVLAAAVQHVMSHGLADLSLRSLAAAIGSSPRMLLYDFGTADELMVAVITGARRVLVGMVGEQLESNPSPAGAVAAMWQWFTEDANRPYALFAVQARQAFLTGKLPSGDDQRVMLEVFSAVGAPEEDHTLVMAVFFALLEEHLAGHVERSDRAMTRFLSVLRTS